MKKIAEKNLTFLVIFLLILSTGCEKGKVPIITTSSVSNITGTSAVCGGNITSEGSSTVITRGVCWSTNLTPKLTDNKTTDGAGAGSFSSNITDLNGATIYYTRAYATNGTGTGYGMVMSFTTFGQSPLPTIGAATNINTTTATLKGTVNANYLSTVVTFEYGISTSYGDISTATQSPVTGNANTNVSANITGLTVATIYHYRIKAVNSLGTTYSNDITFTTLGQVPIVTTLAATSITPMAAQLNATVNANYLSTVVTFEYGSTISYGNTTTATQSPVTGNTSTNVSADITGLVVGATYHFRAKAENSLGTTYGSDMIFSAVYVIGGNANGGIIFYIDVTGLHGLVCAPTNQSTSAAWGCSGTTLLGADGTAIGTGNQNTIDIINGCSTTGIAAKICYDLVLNGYTDWFLPSSEELGFMYTNLKANGLGSFANSYYWSSTEVSYNGAWALQFQDGSQNVFGMYKYSNYNVRAVRAF
jgi:hypothetical protein